MISLIILCFIFPSLVGFIIGVKCLFLIELLIAILICVTCFKQAEDKELEGLLYWFVALSFVVGIVLGDIFVFAKYKDHRCQVFSGVSEICTWLFTPPNLSTNEIIKTEESI